MTVYDWHKCSEPSGLVGTWSNRQDLLFWDAREPLAVRHAIEKMTGTLVQRMTDDVVGLEFRGTSGGPDDTRAVRLSLRAVVDGRVLYGLTVEQTKPRRWLTEARFASDCRVALAHRCSQLDVVTTEVPWSRASADRLEALIRETVEADLATAAGTEDLAPVDALKRDVIDALRNGWQIRDAHEEGGSVFSFDGTYFMRVDHGDGPDRSARWTDERSMLDAVANYFDWDTRSPTWPHPPLQRDVWRYLRGRLLKPA